MNYEKLLKAINNNELKEYITSDPKYLMPDRYGNDVMNDFYAMVVYLNKYGKDHSDFETKLKSTIMEVIYEGRIYCVYSIMCLIKEQIDYEKRGLNSIDFIDLKLITFIKEFIIKNRDALENSKFYEGALYSNGLIGVYEDIDKKIKESKGQGIGLS